MQRNILTRLRYRIEGDPQRVRAWSRGSEGERILGERLDHLVSETLHVLHDRRVPNSRANIDHIVVAPAGVHVIDAKFYTGKVDARNKGGMFRSDYRLYVGGRDRTKLVHNLAKQILAVDRAIRGLTPTTPTTAVLCFVKADWSLLSDGWKFDGVNVASPKKLEKLLRRPGPLDADQIQKIGRRLVERLAPA